MLHIFRIALLVAFCFAGCGSVLSLSPSAESAEVDGEGEEDVSNADIANADVADGAEDGDNMDEKATEEMIMQEMDKDNDGFLSRVEVISGANEEVEESDKKLMETVFNTADA